jgi:hypothetical protein
VSFQQQLRKRMLAQKGMDERDNRRDGDPIF